MCMSAVCQCSRKKDVENHFSQTEITNVELISGHWHHTFLQFDNNFFFLLQTQKQSKSKMQTKEHKKEGRVITSVTKDF